MALIRTHRLTKRFSGTEALHGLDLEVPEGSVFALTGPNGAGKTTAIKTVMNIIRPSSGTAEVLGKDSRALGPAEFAQIGYVSENQRVPEWMRVGYFLAYCKAFYPAWDMDLQSSLVRSFDLPLNQKIRALSRGMRIKASLASSLAYRPKLLILDEPFGGLDVLVREELIESLLERTPDTTVLLASHDLAEIESFASHVGYLERGRLQFVEEMGALSDRFREIEIVLDAPAPLPGPWPAHWLNPEHSGAVVRFTDSRYERQKSDGDVRELFSGVRGVSARSIPVRTIFVALAKAARKERPSCA
jgi:ABC-2 type transport system ATP-binding protein